MFDEHNSGTKPIAQQHQFDVEKQEVFLRKNLPGISGPISAQQFRVGQSNPTCCASSLGNMRRK